MENVTNIHVVTVDTAIAKEECSMHYALVLHFQTKKKQ